MNKVQGTEITTLLELKDRPLLTILGSYEKKSLKRLEKLRDCLRSRGYVKSRLVTDYSFPRKTRNEDEDQYFRRKSIYWLENSDACIFIFFQNAKNDGVAFELKHACDHLESHLDTCLVAIEERGSLYSTSLIRGTVTLLHQQQKLNRRFFNDDVQLCRLCSAAAIGFLRKRRYYLLERDR
jgi:hypothetical protein